MQKFGINPERISLKNQKLPKVENDKTIGRRLSRESTGSSEKIGAFKENNSVKPTQTRTVERAIGARVPSGPVPGANQRGKQSGSRKPRQKQKKMYKKKYIYSDTYREFYGPAACPLFVPPIFNTCNTNFPFTPRNSPRHIDVPVNIPDINLGNNISKLKIQNSVQDSLPENKPSATESPKIYLQTPPEGFPPEGFPLKQTPKVTESVVPIVTKLQDPEGTSPKNTLVAGTDNKQNTDSDAKQKNKKTKCENRSNNWIIVGVIILILLIAIFYLLGRTA